MKLTTNATEAFTVTELAKAADENVPAIQFTDSETNRDFVVIRNDFKLEQVTPENKAKVYKPQTIEQLVSIDTRASLIDYVNRFKNIDTVLFADITNAQILAAIDYHGAAFKTADNEVNTISAIPPRPELVDHTATLELDHSEQWVTWADKNEVLMRHVDFATFLEENSFDVTTPPGAELLELCRDLQVNESVQFGSSIRYGDNVSVEFQKANDATTKSKLNLPVSFEITIPVYFGEGNVKITCMMRRKIEGGSLRLAFKMLRLEQTKQMEFNRIATEVKGATELTLVYGRK